MEEKAQQIHEGATQVEHAGRFPLYKPLCCGRCVPHYLHSHVRVVFEVYPFSIGPIVVAICVL